MSKSATRAWNGNYQYLFGIFTFTVIDGSNLDISNEPRDFYRQSRERKMSLFPPCVLLKKLTAPIMHLSSPTEGISAKAITDSIQWQLMVHSKPRTSNLSRVIVKIISFFFFSLSSPVLLKHHYSLENRWKCLQDKKNHQYSVCCACCFLSHDCCANTHCWFQIKGESFQSHTQHVSLDPDQRFIRSSWLLRPP